MEQHHTTGEWMLPASQAIEAFAPIAWQLLRVRRNYFSEELAPTYTIGQENGKLNVVNWEDSIGARLSRLRPTPVNRMMESSIQEITVLLRAWSDGDPAALEKLTPLIYDDLHKQAKRFMARENPGNLLQTTALINDAYLRLIDYKNVQWQNRAHFFGVASQIMRRILVDLARAEGSAKRGGEALRVSLIEAEGVAAERSVDLVALDDALNTLASLDPRRSKVVELRFFGGLNHDEIAEVLKVSEGTVRRDWSLAQAWLFRELNKNP
jgi:RNA polymerase sigma factor (TIGR02999 family)